MESGSHRVPEDLLVTFASMKHTRSPAERSLSFESRSFKPMESSLFYRSLDIEATESIDLLLLIIEDWQPWFLDPLKQAVPEFPIEALSQFSNPKTSTMLPSVDHEEGGLSCIMEHINIVDDRTSQQDSDGDFVDVGEVKVRCRSMIVWTRPRGGIPNHAERPIVILITRSKSDVANGVKHHYLDTSYKRWDRLTANQNWVYLDLYFLFTKWDRIWCAVKQNLRLNIAEVQGQRPALPILQQTRRLHQDNNVMINLREHLRIHKASVDRVKQGIENYLENGRGSNLQRSPHLMNRLDDASQLLDYYDMTATSLLEQQSNLLSLAFNIETVSQGQAVARLNALALVFLPLSFAASIFGITTLTVDAGYYPALALPLLFGTIVAAFAANKYFELREKQPDFKSRAARGPPNDPGTSGFFSLPSSLVQLTARLRGRLKSTRVIEEDNIALNTSFNINDPPGTTDHSIQNSMEEQPTLATTGNYQKLTEPISTPSYSFIPRVWPGNQANSSRFAYVPTAALNNQTNTSYSAYVPTAFRRG